jgi:hypothetical protein
MQFALLFYNRPHTRIPEAEREASIAAMLEEMRAWQDELRRAGVFRTGLRLAPADAASSLRRNGDEVLVSDGPFAETKEILGGLAIVECKDFDEALGFAKRCPLARIGTVEVRPEWGAAPGA